MGFIQPEQGTNSLTLRVLQPIHAYMYTVFLHSLKGGPLVPWDSFSLNKGQIV